MEPLRNAALTAAVSSAVTVGLGIVFAFLTINLAG